MIFGESSSRERAQWRHSFSLAGADTSPGGAAAQMASASSQVHYTAARLAKSPHAAVEQGKKELDGRAMLQNLSMQIRTCLRNAEECANLAKIQGNASRGRDFLDLERRWLRLAR